MYSARLSLRLCLNQFSRDGQYNYCCSEYQVGTTKATIQLLHPKLRSDAK